MSLTHLSLFSGIGGLDLAAEWAGFTAVGQCEWADYPRQVLKKHWPDVPRWRDIRTLTKEDFYERTGLHTVDVISGGFPCQPFSVAGKRRGKEDDRYLWPEMLRVIEELKPAWVVGENVAGLVTTELDNVLFNLEGEGYVAQTFLFPAHAVGAHHLRYRTFIVAYSDGVNRQTRSGFQREHKRPIQRHDKTTRLASIGEIHNAGKYRTTYGLSNRVDRLRCLGNAVVPQQAYPIFRAIADIMEAG